MKIENKMCPVCEEYRDIQVYADKSICTYCHADFATFKQMQISMDAEIDRQIKIILEQEK